MRDIMKLDLNPIEVGKIVSSMNETNKLMVQKFEQIRAEPLNLDHLIHQVAMISDTLNMHTIIINSILKNAEFRTP